jgi:WD40 repeat protein/class 3 adenylate cyclase
MRLPTGIVTFLFTDIEGSTRFWERLPDSMRRLLDHHNAILAASIDHHRGHVFKEWGDQFCAVFADPRDAVEAAIDAQSVLHEELPQVRVRMALHTGAAELIKDDYFGPALSHVARLLDAGHGGQVLLSQAAAGQLWAEPRGEVDLQSLGEHRLRDIPVRDGIFQLVVPGLPREFPPLNTLDVAFRRGVSRALAVSSVVLAMMGGLLFAAVHQARIAREQTREARRQRYVAQMGLAFEALKAHRFDRLTDLLNKQQPRPGEEDLRGFEWRYLWRQSHRELISWPAEGVYAQFLQFLSDGKTLVTGTTTNTLSFWNAATGTKLESYGPAPADGAATARACSPDGRWLATATCTLPPQGASQPMTWQLQLWDRVTQRDFSFRGRCGAVASLAFSPDGKRLAAGLDAQPGASAARDVLVWDLATRRERVLRGHTSRIWSLTLSQDGGMLAAGGEDGTLRLWHLSAPRAGTVLRAGRGAVESVSFSADSSRLAAVVLAAGNKQGSPSEVKLWEVATGRRTAQRVGLTDALRASFSPQGAILAIAGLDGSVRLWGLRAGRQIGQLDGHTGLVRHLSFSPDGRTLATAGADGTIRCWDIRAALMPEILQESRRPIRGVLFSRDGSKLVAFGDDGVLRVRQTKTLQELDRLRVGNDSPYLELSPDARTVAMARKNDVWIYDIPSRHVSRLVGPGGQVTALAFSPDGKTLVAGSSNALELCDLPEKRGRLLPRRGTVYSLAFTPDGSTLAAEGFDQPGGKASAPGAFDWTIRLWDVPKGQEMQPIRVGREVSSRVTFSPDGRTAAAGTGRSLTLVDLASGRARSIPGDDQLVQCVTFSPDGRTIATGGDSGAVRLWDVATRQEVGVLRPASTGSAVGVVAFSPDGSTLVAGCDDGTIWLWRAASLPGTF